MSFIRIYQLDIMLYMSGICGILALLTMITESLSGARKSVLFLMEFSAMLLLLFDRASYTFRGDTSDLGFMMVRISNGLVFFLCVFIPHLVTQYLKDLYREEGSLATTPFCLKASDILFVFGTALIVVSQFTGLYYTFDEQNIYHRASGFAFSYTVPMKRNEIRGYSEKSNRTFTYDPDMNKKAMSWELEKDGSVLTVTAQFDESGKTDRVRVLLTPPTGGNGIGWETDRAAKALPFSSAPRSRMI